MLERHHQFYLAAILDFGRAIQSNVHDIAFVQFIAERMHCTAVVCEFEIIGEAVGKLPETVKTAFSGVQWSDIKDFRNLLAHEYFGVDLKIVMNAVKTELPLLCRIRRI